MKQKDFIILGAVVIVSAVFSIILSNKLISTPKNLQQSVKTVGEVSNSFPKVDATYINNNSTDPDLYISLPSGSIPYNTNPFK
jgi:archaellin